MVFQNLKSWLTAGRPAESATNPRRFTPGVEALHDRITPSASVVNGNLAVLGTNFNDEVFVTNIASHYRVSEYDNRPGPTLPRVTFIPVAGVTGDLIFHGWEGDDRLINDTAVRTVAFGGNGKDTLAGGSGNDLLYGEAGGDILYGRDGHDTLFGGTGLDYLFGGGGSDRLDGGVGDGEADHLSGGLGADWFRRDPVSFGPGGGYGYVPTYNRDRPVDFVNDGDTFYN